MNGYSNRGCRHQSRPGDVASDRSHKSVGLPPISPIASRPPRLTADLLSKLDSQGIGQNDFRSRAAGGRSCAPPVRSVSGPPPSTRNVSLPPLPSRGNDVRSDKGQTSVRALSAHQGVDGHYRANLVHGGYQSTDAKDAATSLKPHGGRRASPGPSSGHSSRMGTKVRKAKLARNRDWTSEAHADAAVATFPCPHCGRYFCAEAHRVHVRICLKVFKKKRKAFDSKKQRMLPDALALVRSGATQRLGGPGLSMQRPGPLNANWRQQSASFRRALREARAAACQSRQTRPLRKLHHSKQTSIGLGERVLCPTRNRLPAPQRAMQPSIIAHPAEPPRQQQSSSRASQTPSTCPW